MKCKNYLLSLLENIPLWYEDVQLNRFKIVIYYKYNDFYMTTNALTT